MSEKTIIGWVLKDLDDESYRDPKHGWGSQAAAEVFSTLGEAKRLASSYPAFDIRAVRLVRTRSTTKRDDAPEDPIVIYPSDMSEVFRCLLKVSDLAAKLEKSSSDLADKLDSIGIL